MKQSLDSIAKTLYFDSEICVSILLRLILTIESLLTKIMPPADLGFEHVALSSYAAHTDKDEGSSCGLHR